MKRLSALSLSLAAALALTAAPIAFAGQRLKQKPGATTAKAGTTKVSGFIKGAPTGKTFVISSRGATTTVDATNARIHVNGKFGSWDAVKAGTQANVTGTMQGGKLVATDVDLHPRGPAKPGGRKTGGT